MTFHAIKCDVVGSLDDYRFTYDLWQSGHPTAAEARDATTSDLGHDDFLIGDLPDGTALVDLVGSDLKPLTDWGQYDYRAVADGVGVRWEPRPGTAAAAPETIPAGGCPDGCGGVQAVCDQLDPDGGAHIGLRSVLRDALAASEAPAT